MKKQIKESRGNPELPDNGKNNPARLLIVKMVTILLLSLHFSPVFGRDSFSARTLISVKVGNVAMTEVFRRIEAKSDCVFLYEDAVENELQKIVSVDARRQKLSIVLEQLFEGTDLNYKVNGRQVIVYRDPARVILAQAEPEQAKIPVKGVITDNTGEPLTGVNIQVKGTTSGVISGIDGDFNIDIPDVNTVLVFSYVGFETQEIKVGSKKILNIMLKESVSEMEEIVVVGYSTQKKESVVGSIVQTTSKELMKSGNITDINQALTGRLPGVTTSVSTGEPGGYADGASATQIFIRGRNSWNNSAPLILVDGVERNMNNLEITEIASISVLKDASATAVFGVKGANGVILVTTKRGEDTKPQITFSYNSTALTISRLPDKLDSYDTRLLRNEDIERNVSRNETLWADYTPMEIVRRYRDRSVPEYEWVYPNVDWTKAMFKDVGWSNRAAMNISGGTNFVKYFGNASYLHESDMFKEYNNNKGYKPSYGFDRFNFRTNFDFSLTQTTLLKVNLSGFFSQKNTTNGYNNTTSNNSPMIWAAAYRMPSDVFPIQYPDGAWGGANGFPYEQMQNPVSNAYNLGIWERKTTQLNADLTFEQKLDFILKGLKFTGSFFYDNSIMTLGGIYDAANNVRLDTNTKIRIVHQDSFQYPGQPMSEYTQDFPIVGTSDFDWVANPWTLQPEAVNGGSITRRMMYQAQMSYNGRFAEKHTVGAMGLFKREEYAAGSMFPNYREDWVFRTTYDYDSRYFFEGNGAYNGSEKFSSDYRFDFFPSFAIGWYVSNEKFFKLPFMNKLKLRYSLGKVGDDSAGSRWLYQAQYSVANRVRLQTNLTQTSPYPIYRQSVVPNPDARWETATKNNFGIETGFFKDMLGINFDYFKEDRKDILIGGTSRSIPPYFGFDPPAANLGRVKANGYELEISFTRRMNIGLTYWMQTAITHTRNKIIERDDPALQVAYLKNAGYPIGQTRVQVAGDVYKTWDEIYASIPQQTNDLNKIFGFYDIVDFNADGIITGDDNAPLGFPTVPENTYNFSLGADYKGFSFMLQFYGVNNVTRYMPSNNYTLDLNVLYAHSLDYWSKDNPNASSFLPRWKTAGSTFIGNYFYYDGAYARLKTAEIAYNLQGSALKRLGVSGLKLYVNGNNLWFWSRMPDDRENNDYGGSADQGAYPMTKRINFGIDLNF